MASTVPNKNPAQKELLKCLEFREQHYFKYCLERKKKFNVHSIQEAVTVGDMAKSMPRICAALENQQVEHQNSMVEIEGMINNQPISVLIDPSASMSYVSPIIIDLCKLVPENFDKSLLVQLATGTKRKVTSIVRNCKIMLNDFLTHVNVNILPLGAYDLLIGMDWLEEHKVLLNCFDKTFTCIDNNGNNIKVKGIPRKVTI